MPSVLVVDDDDDVRRLLTIQLFLEGYEVFDAAGADEARAQVAKHGLPDVAVIDVKLRGMSGFELLQVLRHDAHLPAVFLSGKVQQRDVDAGRALGATYVTKPFDINSLLRAMANAIRIATANAHPARAD
ncbi:MAG TPA: response regulator [Actinomycetota bacterium]|nr:response regulator [Actinomycetota bacterium]